MGLLDDAIRDHLELKRSRGADPTEVAREEREALEPVFPDEPRPPGFEDEPQAGPVLDEEPPQGDPLEEAAAAAEAPHDAVAAQTFGEETAELDMQAVLDEQDAAEAQTGGEPAAGTAADAAGTGEPVRAPAPSDDELLEWETPERGEQEASPQPLPGQERMSFE
jgi:hypothetical protein